jgi:predicted XRE-type DNA-binding protein
MMKERIELYSVVGVCCLLISTTAHGQNTAPTNAELLAAIKGVSSQLETLRSDVANAATKREVADLSGRLEATVDLVYEQEKELRKLKNDYEVVKDYLNTQLVDQRQILAALSMRDSQGSHVLDIRSNMQSKDFQRDLTDAVNRSLQTHGTLRVENRMSIDRSLRVNGTLYRIAGSSTREFRVPVGTVATELVGYESEKQLTITAPTYTVKLVIAPDETRKIWYGPPVYVNPPIYIEPTYVFW